MKNRRPLAASLLLALTTCGGSVELVEPADAGARAPSPADAPAGGTSDHAPAPAPDAQDAGQGAPTAADGSPCGAPSFTSVPPPSPVWSCEVGTCAAQAAACTADCVCNDAFAQALRCADSTSPDRAEACLVDGVMPVSSNPTVATLLACLEPGALGHCSLLPVDAGRVD
jgi:hypothetical protein